MTVNLRQSLALLIAVTGLFSGTAAWADDGTWVGRKIMTREPGIWIGRTGLLRRQVYVAELTGLTYIVLKEQDGWLSVRHQGAEGWFPKEKAVLVDDALPYFTEKVRANSRDAFALAHRGCAWQVQGEHQKALDDLNEAIRLDPNNFSWFGTRGMAYHGLGEHQRAIDDYGEALRRDPTDTVCYNNRGLAYRAQKDYDRAIKDYSQALWLDAKMTDAYFNRGNAYKARKEYVQAVGDYSEAVRLAPTWADPYFNRANTHRANREYEQAIRDYREVLRLDPKDADALNNLAWLLATCPEERLRDGRQAVEYASRACDLTSWKASYFLATLAAACAEAGDFRQAIRWQERALESPQYERNEGTHARRRLALFENRRPYREEIR
jgi:tetratricopeptide (TPR) repeat protein